MKNRMVILIALLLLFPLSVRAELKCPDGYTLEGDTCAKYSNAFKESNIWTCPSGYTKVNGNKCRTVTNPTNTETNALVCREGYVLVDEECKPESTNNSPSCQAGYVLIEGECKQQINCTRSDNKICKCEDDYNLKGNWCVKYSNMFKESNQWHCAPGYSKVTVDGTEKCEAKKAPTLVDKPSTTTTTTSTTQSASAFAFCSETGVLKAFNIVGYLITLIKVIVPLLLLIFGTIDFAKAMIAGDDKGIKTAAQMLAFRAVGGIVIFFIPTIIYFAVGLIAKWSTVKNEFSNCHTCLSNASKCKTLINAYEALEDACIEASDNSGSYSSGSISCTNYTCKKGSYQKNC